MKKPQTIAAYIAAASPKTRMKLKQLRAAIRSAAPQAEEKISYGMPYYGYHGRLIYFAGFNNHIGLYVMGGSRAAYAKQIQKYQTSLATLHFPIDRPLPIGLIKKLVIAQVRANARSKKQSS